MTNFEAGAYLISDPRAFTEAYADDTDGVFLYGGWCAGATTQEVQQ